MKPPGFRGACLSGWQKEKTARKPGGFSHPSVRISALAGLGEEMLFRGVIQQGVADWVGGQYGVWFGLAVAAILFGLAHHITFTYALLAGLIGLYLGGMWLLRDNLLLPIITHAMYDFIALTYLVRVRNRESGEKPLAD